MSIPKIIHKLVPTNKEKWHPIWFPCLESWKERFPYPEFYIHFWNDEDIDELIKKDFSQYWDLCQKFPFQICKIDFVRFCILYKYGGIYSDMDIFCFENFYNELNGDLFLVEALATNEKYQNSMFAAVPKQEFFLECMAVCEQVFNSNEHSFDKECIMTKKSNNYVLDVTGPRLLSKVATETKHKFNTLNKEIYNPIYNSYNENVKTKHMLSGSWGKELMDIKSNVIAERNNKENYYNFMKEDYKDFRKIDVDSFDFKKNY